MLELRNGSYLLQEKAILSEINLRLNPCELVSIVGPNGAGKSTLLGLIAGSLSLSSGERLAKIASDKIYLMAQDYRKALLPWFSLKKNITLPCLVKGGDRFAAHRELDKLIEALALELPGDSLPESVSGGQAQLALLLRGLMSRPQILLLDEPFSALDYLTVLKFREYLTSYLKSNQITTVLVSHSLETALTMSDRILVLGQSPAIVLADILVRELRDHQGLSVAQIHSDLVTLLRQICR